ncbi:MAG: hypothetical protein JSV96_07680 [Candidatus Aminicenantes bacterium]|nr:MAG: hypothetical protein JSV96_07680 [Candidatus Aminicenantes bacterium]
MRKSLVALLIITVIIPLSSCISTSSVRVSKPYGERFDITMKNLVGYEGELLAVSKSQLYFKDGDSLYLVSLSEVKKVHIRDYQIKSGIKTLAVIPSLIIEFAVFLAAVNAEGGTPWALLSAASIPATVLGFTKSGAKVTFSPPLKEDEIKTLRLYCRYPQGLTEEQWSLLLKLYNQKDFLRLPRK